VKRSQEKEAGNQHRDRHPEVNVGKNVRERALLWRDFSRDTALLKRGAAMLGQIEQGIHWGIVLHEVLWGKLVF
jgi:hypothetical protein